MYIYTLFFCLSNQALFYKNLEDYVHRELIQSDIFSLIFHQVSVSSFRHLFRVYTIISSTNKSSFHLFGKDIVSCYDTQQDASHEDLLRRFCCKTSTRTCEFLHVAILFPTLFPCCVFQQFSECALNVEVL
jgi:hypothetical protein